MLVLGLLAALGWSQPLAGESTKTAIRPCQPVEKVECSGAPGQSYALYLPSTYSPDKQWPILYCFDPAYRGMLPLQLFRDAA